ncbi:hypothetical protein QVD17_08222 [Tagetes erecta]|uniref:Uncharacterized protein n=1 Tax=Tagetes erecta TaxID=13708 RepID=A0AAD8L2K8_TARER|nr:hypothetical protein QVD17_08222 [Tagetes erecta]
MSPSSLSVLPASDGGYFVHVIVAGGLWWQRTRRKFDTERDICCLDRLRVAKSFAGVSYVAQQLDGGNVRRSALILELCDIDEFGDDKMMGHLMK